MTHPSVTDPREGAETTTPPDVKAAVDARAIAGGHRGMGVYASHIARALLELDSPHEFVVYVDEHDDTARLTAERTAVVRMSAGPLPGRAGRVWASTRPPRRRSGDIDVLLATDLSLSPPVRAPVVGFVHDLIPLSSEAAQRSRDWPLLERALVRTAGTWVYRRSLRRLAGAAHLLTNSEYTRQEVLAHLPEVDPERITVTHLAADPAFAPVEPRRTLERLNIRKPYVLYVGGADPRKNVGALLGALDLVREQIPELRLVLVGNEFHDGRVARKHRALFARIAAASESDAVVLPGYVDRPTLQALYSGATCYVNPSLHEGFGIPALEAMRCRCPVVAGANTAQIEVVGDAGLLVRPEPGTLAAAISSIATDADLRGRLQDRGEARAAEFSWERTAKQTLAILEEVAVAHPR